MEKEPAPASEVSQRDIFIDYLRAFVILLVVLLHSALAYTSFSTFDYENWVKSSAPIVDTNKFTLFDPVIGYLDTFLMPLMFLVSGFFIISGLKRYGGGKYLIHRINRLGVPFIFAVLFIAHVSFLPSFLASNTQSSLPYLLRFYTYDGWPIGPPWFLWVLLAFNAVIVLLHKLKPDLLKRFNSVPRISTVFLTAFLAFFPLRLIATHHFWFSLGFFDLQPIRTGLYFSCLVIGIAIGYSGTLQQTEWLNKWPIWLLIGLASSALYLIVNVNTTSFFSVLIISITFTAGSIGSSLGLLGAFKKLVKKRNVFFDSLSANSFGIYIIHYAYTLWLQYFLLSLDWAPMVKLTIVFSGSVLLSWGTSELFRRIPVARRFMLAG